MKIRATFALMLGMGVASCKAVEERMVTSVFSDYVEAQEALAVDDYEEAKKAIQAMAGEADGHLREVASRVAAAENIEEVRSGFKELSGEMLKGKPRDGYAVVFCPMADQGKGARWIQKEGEIANPYLGSSMPTCGTIEESAN
ncbi:MAG: hypothetical protein ACE5JX_06155 [Acidobacteriota bacterium]